jgi:glycosyltransferase involved in cell wall biosynthesis
LIPDCAEHGPAPAVVAAGIANTSQVPRISVVMPLYNKAAHVAQSLSSVLAQSFSDYELIVIDDGSTDGGPSVVRSHETGKVRLISQANVGVSAARNRGMRESAADWIAFLDADDVWHEDHLSQLWRTHVAFPQASLIANDYSMTATAAQPDAATTHRRMTGTFIDEAARGEAWVFTSAAMVRKDAALAIGGFAKGESRGEDIDLWVRMALGHEVALSSHVGAVYRQVKDSLTASTTVLEPDVAMRTIATRIAGDPDLKPELRLALVELSNRLALANATECLLRGYKAAARKFLAQANGTRYWTSRRRVLAALTLLPAWAVRALFSLRRALR